MSQSENLFWKKKEFVSFLLSFCVFFNHASSFLQYPGTGSVVSLINEKASFFLQESITRFAVPLYFILSGIAFFKGYDNSKYVGKIKSRVFTLVIPYLLWNTIWMLFNIVCSYTFLSQYFVGREVFSITLINVLKGIFFYGCNLPFWFVFNLIVFSAAAPLVYLVVRNKYVGIAAIVALTVLANFDIGLPVVVFHASTSIVYYLIGALIGQHYFDLVTKPSAKWMQWASVAFLAVYIALKNVFADHTYPCKILLQVVVFVLASFAFWNVTDMFIHRVRPRKLYARSFAIYALHSNVAAIITKLIVLCFPKSEWMAIPNFIATIILTVLTIHVACTLLEKFLPKVYAVLMGNRLKRT